MTAVVDNDLGDKLVPLAMDVNEILSCLWRSFAYHHLTWTDQQIAPIVPRTFAAIATSISWIETE
jgi:hypothetical protein